MNDKIVSFISSLDLSSYDNFINEAKVDSSIILDDEINDYDFSWLNEVEKYLPFISNIVNFDYREIRVLRSYENRFIKTLIYRLYDFLLTEQKRFNSIDFNTSSKSMNAKIRTVTNNETIDIDINVRSVQNEDLKKGDSYGLSLKERIERAITITLSLLDSEFMKQLSETALVHSPIEKSPLFEEELNYRKALELFEYIENYDIKGRKNDINIAHDKLNDSLLITSFFEYQLLKECNKKDSNDNIYKLFLERIIEKMVLETSMDEKSFKKMLTKKFEEEYTKKKNREKSIQNIFIKNIDNYNKQVKDALRALKN